MTAADPAIVVDRLSFSYPDATPLFRDLSLALPWGARCLLLGQNGAGKTTLLRLLGGRHLIDESAVRVLGRAAFQNFVTGDNF